MSRLHYYHHVLTSIFCTMAGFLADKHGSYGLVTASFNMAVHAVMYTYFAFMAVSSKGTPLRRMTRRFSFVITLGQFLQMVVAVYIFVYGMSYCPKQLGRQNDWCAEFGMLMYLFYMVLFGELFVKKIRKAFCSDADAKVADAKPADALKKPASGATKKPKTS